MAAATDKLMEVGIATATTLDANYTINDTSITVASTSGWPTATGVAFAIDVVDSNGVQVPGTYNEYVGVVSSATSITSVDHVIGTDRNYSAGATTRVYIPVTAERENRIVEWGTVQHKQDGTHADTITTDTINENTSANGITIDGLNIKDGAITTANSIPTTAIQDGAVTPEKLLASTGTDWAWQSYTPTWTSLTVGSGTNIGRYKQIGKTVYGVVKFIYGSGSSVGSSPLFSLPVAANTTAYTATIALLSSTVTYFDSSPVTLVSGLVRLDSSSLAQPILTNVAGTYPTIVAVTATAPFTWATGDSLIATFAYEAA